MNTGVPAGPGEGDDGLGFDAGQRKLHFSKKEFTARQDALRRLMMRRGLDGMLLFRQESLYWLTGFDTFGYVFFQCLYLGADGTMTLLCRRPDLLQARQTSVIEDVRVWTDGEGAAPELSLRHILSEHGCRNHRLGVEFEAYGLTGRNCQRLEAALEGYCILTDASELISGLRLVKSPAEIDYVRRAAELADQALDAAVDLARPGADEAAILAAMQGAVLAGGGDYPGNEFIIGSGPTALLVRYHSGRRVLAPVDQLTLEFAGVYRRYHACLMRTLAIGDWPAGAGARRRRYYDAAVEALLACQEAVRPGNTFGDVYQAHERTLGRAGLGEYRMTACGYSLGTTFAPNWMDWPMFYRGNPVVIEPGMVLFLHMLILDHDRGIAMTLGQTVLSTAGGCEVLSQRALASGG